MVDWPGNNVKIRSHSNFKLKFSKKSWDVLVGFLLKFGLIWEVWNSYEDWRSSFYSKSILIIVKKGSGFLKQKWDLWKAFGFSNIFRFLDGPFTFNNNYNDIYHNKLELKKENEDPCKALFLSI